MKTATIKATSKTTKAASGSSPRQGHLNSKAGPAVTGLPAYSSPSGRPDWAHDPQLLPRLREIGEWMAYGFYEAIDLPWPRSFGRAFRRFYENMEIRIHDEMLLIPNDPFPVKNDFSLRADIAVGAILPGCICTFRHSPGICINPEIAEEKKKQFPHTALFIDDLVTDLVPHIPMFGVYTHSNPDIPRIVSEGFDAMEQELDAEIAKVEAEGAKADHKAINLLAALKDYTIGVRAFHARTLTTARQAAERATGSRKADLARVAQAFKTAFLKPATSFLEGILALHFAWLLDGCDSLGRVDQALGDLFVKDLDRGIIDLEFARRLIDDLFRNVERLQGWNLQIGGYRPDGTEGFNRLTHELIIACGRNRFRRPNVAFRITRGTPDDVLMETMKVLSTGSGRPALYNDDLYVQRLLEIAPDLGLTPEDARDYGFGGCTETMIPGRSNIGSTEGSINLAKALELSLHDGFDPISKQQVGPHTGPLGRFANFNDFLEAVKRQIQFMQDDAASTLYRVHRRRFTEGDPKLYRTFFTRDCVKRHKSFEAGGARYNGSCLIYQGTANLIDGIAAIRKCLFDDKTITATELLKALERDFVGYDNLRSKLLAAPKYGNDDPYVDDIGREITKFAFENLYAQPHARGGRYLPHSAVFTTYAEHGLGVGALPDGRKKGTVLSDSMGPAQGRDTHGPTAMLKSVARLPLSLAIGTPVLNIRFQKKMLSTKKGLVASVKLIRTFFSMGGMQMQVSVVSREDMLAAQKDPERYKDIIVRIGGYSEYFTNLNRALQESVITRTEHGA